MHNYIAKGIALVVAIAASGTVQAIDKKNPDSYFSGVKIFALKEAAGSEWDSVTGEAKYLVTYKVTLDNFSDESIEPGKDNKMCFFLYDKNGKSFMSTGIEMDMLKKYKPIESRTGNVFFSSADPEILNIPFVRLAFGKDCLTK
ncbi:hypothetical protein B6J05_24605 [Klebsiella quasipneumoniae]|uniref:DUF4354 family protein n=1 Tax=Klebsiella quasipneumoniae TaxID=1463165 RepID=UPI000C7C9687|nr:DUF4354 family protein [Klebsiella quasipneumoniae]MBV0688148.1 DUF4354 family protein [Klebsiella quasipneumoniae]PLG15233.1 hypothetical protein B6J05_24605 [Klebsiella quasipneumoniae]HCB1571783.1 DUF4354 family protein [Klebsiella quasipneumoniae]HCB1792989.1 DUF4354 family protein [Klebsiella quasipneumoniae]